MIDVATATDDIRVVYAPHEELLGLLKQDDVSLDSWSSQVLRHFDVEERGFVSVAKERTEAIAPQLDDPNFAGNTLLNRRTARSLIGSNIFNAGQVFEIGLAHYLVANDITDETEIRQVLSSYTKHKDIQTIFIQSVTELTEMIRVEQKVVTDLRQSLIPQLENEPVRTANLIVETIMVPSEEPSLEEITLLSVLAHDFVNNRNESVAYQAIKETETERRHDRSAAYLNECLANTRQWMRQSKELSFARSFIGDISDAEFVERVIANEDHWAPALKEGFIKFFSEKEADFSSMVLSTLKKYFTGSVQGPLDLPGLRRAWLEFTRLAPAPIPGNTVTRFELIRDNQDRKNKNKQQHSSGPANKSTDSKPEEAEVIKPLQIVVLKDTGEGYVIDDNHTPEDLIDDYLKTTGNNSAALKAEFATVLEYLQKREKTSGIEKLEETIVLRDERTKPLAQWRLKPGAVEELTGRHTPTFKQARFIFVQLNRVILADDDTREAAIGLIDITKRDGNNYRRRRR